MDTDSGRVDTKFGPPGPSNGNAKTNKRGTKIRRSLT